jgi:hypothetical protein
MSVPRNRIVFPCDLKCLPQVSLVGSAESKLSGTGQDSLAITSCYRQIARQRLFWGHRKRECGYDLICVCDSRFDLDFFVAYWPSFLDAEGLMCNLRQLNQNALHDVPRRRFDVGGPGSVNDGTIVGPQAVSSKDGSTWILCIAGIEAVSREIALEMRNTDIGAKGEVRRHALSISTSQPPRNPVGGHGSIRKKSMHRKCHLASTNARFKWVFGTGFNSMPHILCMASGTPLS